MNQDWLNKDYTTLPKAKLLQILNTNNIHFNLDETVADLRPKIVSLKTALILVSSNPETEPLFKGLINADRPLTAEERTQHPSLAKLESLIKFRHHYYEPASINSSSEEDDTHHLLSKLHINNGTSTSAPSNIYEDVNYNLNSQDLAPPRPNSLVETGHSSRQFTPINQITHTEPQSYLTNTNMAEKLPLISAGIYTGSPNESCLLFIEKFELAAKCNQWTEQTKLNLFPAHLNGTALTWMKLYTEKTLPQNLTWNNVRSEFIKTFTPLAHSQNLNLIMEHKIQAENQPSLNFLLDVVQTCKLFDPNIAEKSIVDYVISGLRPEICDKIILLTNNTLTELEDNIKRAEMQILTQNQNKAKYLRETHKPNPQVAPSADQDTLNKLQNEIKILTNTISSLTIQNSLQNRGRSPTTNDTTRDNKQNYPRAHETRVGHNTNFKRVSFSPVRYNQYRQPNQQERWCSYCRTRSHNTFDCWSKPRHSSRHYSGHSTYCRYCKQTGHTIEQCRKAGRNQYNNNSRSKNE